MQCVLHYNSFQNYTDYFKCVAAKGEDFAPCKQFKRAYNSLCPSMFLFYSVALLVLTLVPLDEWVGVQYLGAELNSLNMLSCPGSEVGRAEGERNIPCITRALIVYALAPFYSMIDSAYFSDFLRTFVRCSYISRLWEQFPLPQSVIYRPSL